jgi:hypothetical protein
MTPVPADPEVLRHQLQRALEEASASRAAGDAAACEATLAHALPLADALGDPPLLAAVAWRLAKARYDRGADGLLDALAPLTRPRRVSRGMLQPRLEVGPFDDYPAGLRALPALSSRHRDHHGYGHPVLAALWVAWIAHHRAAGDAYLVAWGELAVAWDEAARGAPEAVEARLRTYDRLPIDALAGSAHRHPDAPDAAASLPLVLRDFGRTWLCGATWAGDAIAAAAAWEHVQDTLAEHDLALDPWTLDAVAMAALRFGWPTADLRARLSSPHAAALPAPHAARTVALAAALAGERAAPLARQAGDAAHDHRAGPEWAIAAWRLAAAHGDADAGALADAEAARTSVCHPAWA